MAMKNPVAMLDSIGSEALRSQTVTANVDGNIVDAYNWAPHMEKQRVVSLGWQSQRFSEIIKNENIGETDFANNSNWYY